MFRILVCTFFLAAVGLGWTNRTTARQQPQGPQGSAPVRVINTPKEPVPIVGSVQVSAPVSVTSGAPLGVMVNGVSTVKQAEEPARSFLRRRQEFHVTADTGGIGNTLVTVPIGKHFVLQHFGLSGKSAPVDGFVEIHVRDGQTTFSVATVDLMRRRNGVTGNMDILGNGSLTMYADEGESIFVTLSDLPGAEFTMEVSLTGYLVDRL